ncbi:Serine/Threonine kinase domain protein (macronuclear) [Tetrahymena thermophila SB210]|uniref:non-specific serine/threonine protein kinase n=1 Tax=Tetrahymena thermophila (strain SB210) TaxID=312017 RepID=I7M450_TETTS|nr:Serine/Threonine kinase domain protein [Tetrahymena thermophila SB210]EAS04911.2 Serine/Threonine kinase domain protein [Tetrahymena thermophila SB210]|eukprot:XP_001025156.2 Serine/Threonine kinase domain protein [Tetrahymena thermophila SB210]
MKQESFLQVKNNLLNSHQAISIQELKQKGPKNIIDNIQYSLSDDDYDDYQEEINYKYAKILQMDQQSIRTNHFLQAPLHTNRQNHRNSYLGKQQNPKPRSNTPRKTNNNQDDFSKDSENEKATQQNFFQKKKKKPTIKKSQTQEEQQIQQIQEITPKSSNTNQKKHKNSLKNIILSYMEETNELNTSLNDVVNFRIRSSSYDEKTCLFTYITNLQSSFHRAMQFKRETNFEIFDCIEVIRFILVTYYDQMPHQIHITLKELVNIMIDFLEFNTIYLKNGGAKQLLDRLNESEKVFKKYSLFYNSNQKMSEIDNSPENKTKINQNRIVSNPNVSITKELSSNSLNTPQISKTQKSKFYQYEENECQSSKNVTTKSLTKIVQEQEIQDKQFRFGLNVNGQNQISNQEENLGLKQQTSLISIGSSPYTQKITPSQVSRYKEERRQSQESSSSPFQSLFKRKSISIQSYQTQIQKIYYISRYIFTKVGYLLHYQKMQNYFFREEEIMKVKQHQKLRLLQHKRTTSLDPYQSDCTPLSSDSFQAIQSPQSTFSQIGSMSPFLNSPLSSNSSGANQKGSKEDQFNVTILYQKVNENTDIHDQKYQGLIQILRKVRHLENENHMLSKKAKALFYNIKILILDQEENFIQKRQFLLHKFFIWKMKRWYTQYKRQKTESKKMSLFVNQYKEKQVCRICDQKVFLKHFKYHSQLCKEREEIKKDLKINMKQINSEMFYFLQKSRSLGIKCQLLQKKIEKIFKLQEQNMGKQIQVLRRKSFQTFADDKTNKAIIEQGNKNKKSSNSFKEYLNNQRQRNSLQSTSTEKLQIENKYSKSSLNHIQDISYCQIQEDVNDDNSASKSSSSSSSDSNDENDTKNGYKQDSLSQFDKDHDKGSKKGSRKNSSSASRQKLGSSSSLNSKRKKSTSQDIQNKENQPYSSSNQLQQQQQNSQEQIQISSLASIDKQNSKNELPIINEQTEYEEDHSKPFINSDKGIRPIGFKSNTPKHSIKIGIVKEAISASSILCTSDEEEKIVSQVYCPSTPNIDISNQADTRKIQVCKLGQIIEEAETSKNPSKDDKILGPNDIDKDSSENVGESLAEFEKKSSEEEVNRSKDQSSLNKKKQQLITQSIKSLVAQQLVTEEDELIQDKQNEVHQDDDSQPSPGFYNIDQFQQQKVDEEEIEQKVSQLSLKSYNQMDQLKQSNNSSLYENNEQVQKDKDNVQDINPLNQSVKSSKSVSQEDKKISQESENVHNNQPTQEQFLIQQVSPLPEIFEKEFKEINCKNNYQYQESNLFQSSTNRIQNNSSSQTQQDSLVMNQFSGDDKTLNQIQNNSLSNKSSNVNSPDIKSNKKKQALKEDLKEKFNILQKNIKNNEFLNEIESEFSSSGKNNINSSKEMQNKSNNIRLQLNRLASQDITNINSPFKVYQQLSVANSDDKLPNSSHASKSSLKEETNNKSQKQQKQTEDNFTFSQFNLNQTQNNIPQQQISFISNSLEKSKQFIGNTENNIEQENQKGQESQQTIKHIYPVNLRQRIVSNPNPSQLAYQRENNSTSPSSSSSNNGDNKQLNSISFTQFKEGGIIDTKRKSLNKPTKKYGSPLKKHTPLNITPKNKDNQLVQDIVKLSNNFELKIKQHQLKSNHICLRIFELIQQLSKMFFIQDFQNNWKRKRMILEDNKQKIEYLLQKSMIPKDYASKISNILLTFAHRVELLEKLQNIERQLTKQVEDINEEIERTDDNLSNDSGATKQSNITSNKVTSSKQQLQNQQYLVRQKFKSGTHISSRTQISKDSYYLESPTTQSDQQSNPSNNNLTSNVQQISPLKNNYLIQGISTLQNGKNKATSASANQSPEKQETQAHNSHSQEQNIENPRLQERASSFPNNSTFHEFNNINQDSSNLNNDEIQSHSNSNSTMQQSSVEEGRQKSLSVVNSQTSMLLKNKRRMSAQNNLTLDIKNKIVQKINLELSNQNQQNEDKFSFKDEDISKKLSTYEKFDLIMKQAMQKFESDLFNFEKPLKYNNGYFSDGCVENCYQSLENIVKKESNHQINIGDFEFLKLISKGAFGRVWLVKKKNTDNVYAMKIVNLAEKMNKNNLMSLQNERDIFGIVSGDFFVKAVYTFAHESYLCFVMEYMIGGDLGSIQQQFGVLEESVARFYIAEIILACSQLHKAGIVHRDLKPDNLLLDSKGHLKLTDFGLSDMGMRSRNMENSKQKKFRQEYNNLKRGMDRISSIKGADKIFSSLTPQSKSDKTRELKQMKTNLDVILNKETKKMKNKKKFRIIGTPDYIPPEVIKGSNNLNCATLDWWSVGVILFEMLVGIPPFNDETVEKIFDNIINMRVPWDQINIGYGEDEVSPEAEDLIKKLMDPNPQTRLGANGVEEVQSHPFFNNFDWDNVRKMNAPVIPKVKNVLDTSNFDKQIEYTEREKIDPFYGLSKGQEDVDKAKDILKAYNFQMKRYDILYEENCQQLEEIQKKMKFMEEEIKKDEQELEKLEVEYGSDDEDSQEAQPFNIPKSVVTFQDLEQIGSNPITMTFPRFNKEEVDSSYNSLRNISDNTQSQHNSQPNSNKLLNNNDCTSKNQFNKIQEDDQEHQISNNCIEL